LGKHFWPDFSFVSGIRIDYLSPIIYFTDVLIILMFSSFVIRKICFENSKFKTLIPNLNFKFQKKFFIVGFILLFLSVNIILAQRPLLSFYGFIKLIEFSFLAWYLSKTIRSRLQFEQIALLFALNSIFESLIAVFQYLNQGSLNGIFYFFGERTFTGTTPGIANADIGGALILRPYATFPHPNVLAGYLLVAMVFVWSFLLRSNARWMQIVGVVSLILSSIALLLTFGRVAILLWILLVLFIFGRMLVRVVGTIRARVIAGAFIIVGLAVIGMLPLTHEIALRFLETSLSDESVTERAELLNSSWKMIQQHSLIGVGLDNFIPALAPLQKPMPLGLYLQPVHNIFVLVLSETGIIGFGLFIWLIVLTSQRINKLDLGVKNVLFTLFFIVVVTGMFDHYWLTLQQGQLLLTTIFGLSWAKTQQS
jgi:O-antigen ligase